MSAQPEALRIADECEQSAEEWLQDVETRKQAAVELRRLHAENEAKNALLRQAVEALEKYDTPAQRLDGSPCREPIDKRLCAAIRQHLKGANK